MLKERAEINFFKKHKKIAKASRWSCEKSYIDVWCVHYCLGDFLLAKLIASWSVSFCETRILKNFSCCHLVMLCICCLTDILAGLVFYLEYLGAWQFLDVAFVKSDLGKRSCVTMASLTHWLWFKERIFKRKMCLIVIVRAVNLLFVSSIQWNVD